VGTGTQIVHSNTVLRIVPGLSQVGPEPLYPNEEVWDSRVRVQDFLTEDTGRGPSLGSEIEGWFATVERPSSVGPPVSVCGTEHRRLVLGARMGK
jgi:hypothetical protein